MNKPQMYRQGDFLLVKVDTLPEGLKKVNPDPRRPGYNVIGWGEVTTHSHSLLEKECSLKETSSGERFLTVPKSASLIHEEHATIVLPRGNYRVIQQVEYQREFRQVID